MQVPAEQEEPAVSTIRCCCIRKQVARCRCLESILAEQEGDRDTFREAARGKERLVKLNFSTHKVVCLRCFPSLRFPHGALAADAAGSSERSFLEEREQVRLCKRETITIRWTKVTVNALDLWKRSFQSRPKARTRLCSASEAVPPRSFPVLQRATALVQRVAALVGRWRSSNPRERKSLEMNSDCRHSRLRRHVFFASLCGFLNLGDCNETCFRSFIAFLIILIISPLTPIPPPYIRALSTGDTFVSAR